MTSITKIRTRDVYLQRHFIVALLGEAKKILGCSFKTCNEVGRRDMGLETLKSRKDKVIMVVLVSNNA